MGKDETAEEEDDTRSRTGLYRTGRRYVYLYCTVTSLGLGNKLISGVSLPAVYYIQIHYCHDHTGCIDPWRIPHGGLTLIL